MGDHGQQAEEQTGAAGRMRRYRARRRGGARIASAVELTSDVLYAMAIAGWADKVRTRDPVALGKAVADVLNTWARGKLPNPKRYGVTRKRDTRNRPA